MSGTYLLDTNAVIALNNRDAVLTALVDEAKGIFTALTVVGELYFGAVKSSRPAENIQVILKFLLVCEVLPMTLETARIDGDTRQTLQAKGKPIPENDIWIAAIALQYACTLLTRDAHFQHIPRLACQGW